MPQTLKLIPADEARLLMFETPAVGTEVVPLPSAGGRVLALPLVAGENLPDERRATMDGYAVRARDVTIASVDAPATLEFVGSVPMGGLFAGPLKGGEAIGISTGGFLPDGADCVVMIEHCTSLSNGKIAITRGGASWDNVIRPGDDIRKGATVLGAGRRLRPQDVGALACFGTVEVTAYRRPRIAVLSTGNEICEPAKTPGRGQVRDVNQYALGAQAAVAGCQVTYAGIVPDDEDALRAAIARLLPEHDGLILSGGSSVGVRDVSGEVLGALGPPGILFHGINVRPGKPTIFALAGEKPVLGMPGFPTSSMIVFDGFVRPMLWRLGGELGREMWPSRRRARLAQRHPSVAGREDYVRVRLVTAAGGELWAETLPGGSAGIANVIHADGLVVVPSAAEEIAQGQEVDVCLY